MEAIVSVTLKAPADALPLIALATVTGVYLDWTPPRTFILGPMTPRSTGVPLRAPCSSPSDFPLRAWVPGGACAAVEASMILQAGVLRRGRKTQ